MRGKRKTRSTALLSKQAATWSPPPGSLSNNNIGNPRECIPRPASKEHRCSPALLTHVFSETTHKKIPQKKIQESQ